MIENIILLILLIVFTLNIIYLIKIKWNNDYFKKNYDECYVLNSKSLYEIETYRYNLYSYIYNIESNSFKNTINSYNITYILVIILTLILLILYIKDIYINYLPEKIIGIIIILLLLLSYIFIGNLIKKGLNKIEDEKKNQNNNLYKYQLVYKIFNNLLYLNNKDNILNEIFKFKISSIENTKTFDKILDTKISEIYNISDENEINYIKKISLEKLDYIKYINLDNISPFYFKEYFDNIYIIINNKKYYLNELKNNDSINEKIREKIKRDDNIDYVKYFLENKDLIFNLEELDNEITKILNSKTNIIINILIYIIFIMILFHYLYISINSISYSYILFIIILIYLFLLWIKLRI